MELKSYPTGIEGLKLRIKRRAQQGADCRKRIHETRSDERHYWWQEKRSLGDATRHFLLAYGLLRGIAYEAMERTCREAPDGSLIMSLCQEHGGEEWRDDAEARKRVDEFLTRRSESKEAA